MGKGDHALAKHQYGTVSGISGKRSQASTKRASSARKMNPPDATSAAPPGATGRPFAGLQPQHGQDDDRRRRRKRLKRRRHCRREGEKKKRHSDTQPHDACQHRQAREPPASQASSAFRLEWARPSALRRRPPPHPNHRGQERLDPRRHDRLCDDRPDRPAGCRSQSNTSRSKAAPRPPPKHGAGRAACRR